MKKYAIFFNGTYVTTVQAETMYSNEIAIGNITLADASGKPIAILTPGYAAIEVE